MRVDLVVRALRTQGGTERFALGLSRHLVAAGDAVTAWVLEPGERPRGVEIRRLPGPPVRGRLPRMLRLAWGGRSVAQRGGGVSIGLLRAPGFDLWRAGGGCHAEWLRVGAQRLDAASRIELDLDRRAAHHAGRIIVNSQMAARGLVQEYGVSEDSIRLVRNGVDLDRFAPRPQVAPPIPRPAVAFLGHGWQRKGLATALEALALSPGVHLGVMGSDRHSGRFRRLAEALEVSDRVHFLGPSTDPAKALPGYDAFMLPTRYDPSANATLEALACGVPVVTSARDGASEILPDPAWCVSDPCDAAGFADALARILLQRGARDAARSAAARWPAEEAFAATRTFALEHAG